MIVMFYARDLINTIKENIESLEADLLKIKLPKKPLFFQVSAMSNYRFNVRHFDCISAKIKELKNYVDVLEKSIKSNYDVDYIIRLSADDYLYLTNAVDFSRFCY